MLGCLRCKLLAETAHFFCSEWASKIEEENGLVEKGFIGSSAAFYMA
jgi:hypothetical protein